MDGIYTGALMGEMLHGRAKAAAVRAMAAREGLDLRRCTAYSDSINDLPMLSAVGTAVAVNPDSELRDLARQRGWQIRDFRVSRKARRSDRGAVGARGRRDRRRGAWPGSPCGGSSVNAKPPARTFACHSPALEW